MEREPSWSSINQTVSYENAWKHLSQMNEIREIV